MSLVYSNTTNKNGILQIIEKNCFFEDAGITGNATLKSQFTADINLAMDRVLALIFQTGGTWQFDDSNQTDYPIITTNIVSGQRDYSFTTDGSSNLILEIYRVMVKDSGGIFHDLAPVDVNQGTAPRSYTDGLNVGGQPNTYDKLSNAIFLDPIPNYNATAGLKVYINREASYFTTSDTTKKPGFAGLFHEYLALRPSYQYAKNKGLSNKLDLEKEMLKMEADIQDYYKAREKDTQKVLRPLRRFSR